jgi:hypothetical protein
MAADDGTHKTRGLRHLLVARHLPVAAAVGVALLGTSAGLLLSASPASAAGNPTLDKLIISDPESGWSDLSSTETSSLDNSIQTELQAKAASGQTFSTAVEGWQSPDGASTALLVIFLVQATSGSLDTNATSIASNFCSGATDTTPASTPQIPNISSSAIATCAGGGVNATIGTAIKGSTLTMVASTGSQVLGVSDIEPVVESQLNALPGSGGSGGSGSSTSGSSSSTGAIVGGIVGVVVVAGIVIAIVMIMRRRQSGVAVAGAGAPSPPGFGGPPPMGGSGFYPPNQGVAAPPAAPTQPAPTQSAPSYVAPASSSGDDPWGGGADPGWVSPLDSPPVSTPHQDAAQGSAPGWYPEGGDNSLMRYWDGSKFTGRRRWDGSAWVEA